MPDVNRATLPIYSCRAILWATTTIEKSIERGGELIDTILAFRLHNHLPLLSMVHELGSDESDTRGSSGRSA
jgi:hypothetical protein